MASAVAKPRDVQIHTTANGFLVIPYRGGERYGEASVFWEMHVFRNAGELAAWLVTYYAEAA